jgi:hypothetical protein
MSVKSLLKSAIINIIVSDLETEIPGILTKLYSEEQIELYIKKNKASINSCINDYIEEFADDLDMENIDEDWIREYLSECCTN